MSIKETMISAALINTALLFTLFLTAMGGQHNTMQASGFDRFALTPSKGSFYTHSVNTPETSTLPIADKLPQQGPLEHANLNTAHEQHARITSLTTGSQQEYAAQPVQSYPLSEQFEPAVQNHTQAGIIQNSPTVQTLHLVQKGERLEKIAKSYGVSVEQLVAVNELSTTQLKIGQKLTIPSTPTASAAPALSKAPAKISEIAHKGEDQTSRNVSQNIQKKKVSQGNASPQKTETAPGKNDPIVYHYVEAGENPWIIARKYKISLQRLLDLNNLDQKSAKRLKLGSRLRVQ